jgi:hypothetical protein
MWIFRPTDRKFVAVYSSYSKPLLYLLLQQHQWFVKRKMGISPTTQTKQTAQCTICVKEKGNITCLAHPTWCSTPMKMYATGLRM